MPLSCDFVVLIALLRSAWSAAIWLTCAFWSRSCFASASWRAWASASSSAPTGRTRFADGAANEPNRRGTRRRKENRRTRRPGVRRLGGVHPSSGGVFRITEASSSCEQSPLVASGISSRSAVWRLRPPVISPPRTGHEFQDDTGFAASYLVLSRL